MLGAEEEKSVLSLDGLRPGERGRVAYVRQCSPELRQKLLTMGLVPGQIVEVAAVAPLGDPITVTVLGFQLALRLGEAAQVVVERC